MMELLWQFFFCKLLLSFCCCCFKLRLVFKNSQENPILLRNIDFGHIRITMKSAFLDLSQPKHLKSKQSPHCYLPLCLFIKSLSHFSSWVCVCVSLSFCLSVFLWKEKNDKSKKSVALEPDRSCACAHASPCAHKCVLPSICTCGNVYLFLRIYIYSCLQKYVHIYVCVCVLTVCD